MNVQKEVTINELKAKFVKEFDNAGKLNPFVQFSVGKCTGRTEAIEAIAKETAWKDSVVLTFFDQNSVSVKGYDEDSSERDYMGSGKLQIKSLRFPGGNIELNLTSDNGEVIAVVSGKYTIKNLVASPLLMAKNFKVDLIKQSQQLNKCRPYLQLSTEEATSICTQSKDEIAGCTICWNECLRLKIKQSSKITISMIDKDENTSSIFSYQLHAKELRLQSGCKKINILDQSFCPLGQLSFEYETVNLVTKEESVKNQDKQKKAQGQVTILTVTQMSATLPKGDIDVYYKIMVGSNCYKSQVVNKSPKQSNPSINTCLYAQAKENKLIVVVLQKTLIKDQIIASGHVNLESLSNGQNKLSLCTPNSSEESGSIVLNLNVKQSSCKTLYIENICLSISEEGQFIGGSQPFVQASVGCCLGRTETGNNSKMTFKKGIELKYCVQDTLNLQVWDEDVASNSLLYSQSVPLSNLKQKGEQVISVSKAAEGDQPEKKGKVTFKYQVKNPAPESPMRKPTVKQSEPAKKQAVVQKKEVVVDKEVVAENNERSDNLQSARHKKSTPSQMQIGEGIPINRSKQTINLPSIVVSNYNVAYGDRIFDKQSAATLQKSIVAYSMPKGHRFGDGPKYSGEPSYCLDSCFKKNSTKGAGFGFGRKKQFPDWMERNMKENPAPGSYFDADSDLHNRGPTFGLSHKYYQRVLIPREKRPTPTTGRKLSPIRDSANK